MGSINSGLKTSVNGSKEVDLSVIIPVYNSKEFLCECLESIFGQKTSYSYEVIVVDDGSTDCLWELLTERQYLSRIKYINIANSGQGYARNRGIEVCCGRRITFMDADDKMCEDFIETMLSYGEELVQCGFTTFGDGNVKYLHKSYTAESKKDILEAGCFGEGYPWGKVYDRKLFSVDGFPEKVRFEDNNLAYLILPQLNSYRYVDKSLILYRLHAKQETANVVKSGWGLEQVSTIVWLFLKAKEKYSAEKFIDGYLFNVTVHNLTSVLYSRIKNDRQLFEKAFELIIDFYEAQLKDYKYKSFRDRQFKKAVEKKNLSKFILVCRYL